MLKFKKYKPTNFTLLEALLSEGQWLHLLKNKPYDVLKDYLIELSKSYMTEGIPSFKSIREEAPKAYAQKWLHVMFEDLLTLNNENPKLFRTNPDANLLCFEVTFPYNEKSVTYEQYNIWSTGTVHLHDTVFLPILAAIVPYESFQVKNCLKSFEAGVLTTIVSLSHRRRNRYQDWLIQRALHENKLTEAELVLDWYNIDDKLRKWYG